MVHGVARTLIMASIECKSLEDGFNSIHSVDLTCAGKEYNFPNNKKLSTRGSPSPPHKPG